jgi:hypothetical protein
MLVSVLAFMTAARNIGTNPSPRQAAKNCAGPWSKLLAPKVAVRSDPYWKAQHKRLSKIKYPNKAIVAIARRLLVSAWHILTKHEPYRRVDDETIAYKMMIWSQRMDEKALRGLTAYSDENDQ